MKLQYKFALAIFGIGAAFLLAISILYFIEARDSDIHAQKHLFEQTALERGEHISVTLREKAHIASVISQSDVVINALTDSNAQFAGLSADKRRAEIARLSEAWTQPKKEDDPFLRPYTTNAAAEYFKEHERAFPGEYGEIFLTNKYGVIVSTMKNLTNLTQTHKYWWMATSDGGRGREFFDDRGYDASSNGYVIGVTVPVIKDGEIIGRLKCNHDITATLNKVVESFRPGNTGKLMIVRGNGKIVLAPGVRPLTADAPSTLVEKLAAKVSGSLILNDGEVQTLMGYAPVTMANVEGEYGFGGAMDSIERQLGNRGDPWFIVISQSIDEALAESWARTREIALTGIILIALMGLSAMYFGWRMARPVARMEKYARRIGDGDYDIHVELESSDEMGQLAHAFNQMAINLQTTTGSRDKLAEEVERRKTAEEQLKESEQRFRQLAEASFEGIAITEKGRFLDANRAFLDMFGYETVEEITGRDALELTAPEYREIVGSNIAAGSEKPYEIMGMRKDGTFFPIEVRARMMEIAGRRARVTALRDVTERKQAEVALAESENKYRTLVEETSDWVWELNENGVFTYSSPQVREITGYGAGEILGTTPFDYMRPEEARRVVEFFHATVATQSPFKSFVNSTLHKDGHEVIVETNGVPYLNAEGRFVGYRGINRDITERKRAEEALRQTRQLLDSVVENIPAMVFVKRASDLRFELFNQAGEALLGYSRRDLLGKSDYDFFPKEQADFFTAADRKVLASQEITDIPEEPIRIASGETRYLHTWKIALRDETGAPTHLLGISLDITERKKAEEAIRESESRFRLVADSAPVLIWMSGTDAKCNYFNKGWLDFTGRELEDEMGDGWAQGVHPHDRERCVDLYMAAFNTRNRFSIMYRLRRKDGVYRWVLDNGIPRFSSSGEFIGYIGSCFDITDRKEAEEAVARSEKKIRDITSVIGQGVYALDAKGRLTFMNPETERLLGWTEAELLGLDVHKRFHGKKEDGSIIQKCDCPAYKALSSGQTQLSDGEFFSKKGGGVFPASIVASPMIEEGQVNGVVVAFSDITERQRIMLEITEAKERAEEATKLKDKFVSLVAHDLKSPFTSILGMLQVIKDDSISERNRDIMAHVLQNGQQMLRMIDELLDISRLKTGKIKPEFRFFDGSVATAIAFARVSQQAAAKGVSLSNEIPPGTRLYADQNLFDQVLQNLLTNAVKFSARGGMVRVFTPGNGIVAVKDTGVGVKNNFLPLLFRHEEKTTTPGTEGELGTGLGLPLSHDMMVAMGGDLNVESEEGKGSVFYANLPLVVPVALIVDDQAPVRYLLKQYLVRIGVNVVEAEDGEQALGFMEKERPHVVITDIMMPKMSGFDLLEIIKKNPETASTPVIIITADNQMESREMAFRMGADDFIGKPIRAEDLIPRVRRFLG